MSFESPNPVPQKQNEAEALEAIEEGHAMPLPEFLNESPAAREAFANAMQESEYLRDSLNELDPEVKREFLEKFSDAIDIEDRSVFIEAMITILTPSKFDKDVLMGAGALGVTGEIANVSLNGPQSPAYGLIMATSIAAGLVWSKFNEARWDLQDDKENIDEIKGRLLAVAAA